MNFFISVRTFHSINGGIIRFRKDQHMKFTDEAIQEEKMNLNVNHFPFNHPLYYRWIQPTDTLQLSRVIKQSKDHLKGYINWARSSGGWNFKTVQNFVNDMVNCEPPRMHLGFFLGKQLVGIGSLAPVDDPGAVQIALWTAKGFEGKGIGTRIAATMEQYAFEIFGYSRLYYQCDANNESSKRLPQKLGYRFSHTFDQEITAEDETGFWMSWVKDRPIDLEPGLLQGAPMEQFNEIRHL